MWKLLRRLAFWRRDGSPDLTEAASAPLELPWRRNWDYIFNHTAGSDFRRRDYEYARERAREVARITLGEQLWSDLQEQGYLELPSRQIQGLTYRLRVGRRIEMRCTEDMRLPSRRPFLCVSPTYPLPQEEFFAQIYLYLRDREELVLAVAVPQAYDATLARTF